MKVFFFFLLCISIIIQKGHSSSAKLQQVFHIARHGARTPTSFEFKPGQYSEKAGELTVLGKIQHYHLGQEMRKRYIEYNHLISDTYNSNEVVIKSSNTLRVIESAIAFVNGLYPQESGQSHENTYAEVSSFETLLPLSQRIHTLNVSRIDAITLNESFALSVINIMSDKRDLFFHADQGDRCPIVKERRKIIKESSPITLLEESLKTNVYPQIVEVINQALEKTHLSIEELDLQKAKRVLDNYRCNSFHSVERPEFSESMLNHLLNIRYHFIYEVLYKDELVRAIAVSKLLEDINNYMQALKSNTDAPKFIFYAAHDHNIAALLSMLLEESMLTNKEFYMIEFAAVMSIEVYRQESMLDGSSCDEYFIRFLYNDKPLRVKWCQNENCSLEEFKSFVERSVITDLETLCGK